MATLEEILRLDSMSQVSDQKKSKTLVSRNSISISLTRRDNLPSTCFAIPSGQGEAPIGLQADPRRDNYPSIEALITPPDWNCAWVSANKAANFRALAS